MSYIASAKKDNKLEFKKNKKNKKDLKRCPHISYFMMCSRKWAAGSII
jgi:hypothetical protein